MTCLDRVDPQELSAWLAGDLPPDRSDVLARHVPDCPACKACLDALGRVDAYLQASAPPLPRPGALMETLRAVRAVHEVGAPDREVFTLDQAAKWLGASPQALAEHLDELPAFELGGEVFIRRSRLIAWIRRREQAYARERAASWARRPLAIAAQGEPL